MKKDLPIQWFVAIRLIIVFWGLTNFSPLIFITKSKGKHVGKNSPKSSAPKQNKVNNLDDQDYGKRFGTEDANDNNLIPVQLQKMALMDFFPQMEGNLSNGVEIIKRQGTTIGFFQSYNSKPLLFLREPLGKPFLVICHGEKGYLKSFHVLLNYSFDDLSNPVLPEKFFQFSLDQQQELSTPLLIPRAKLSLSNLFSEQLYPYGISLYYNVVTNSFNTIFYYYLALSKNDIEKIKVKEGKLYRKIIRIKKGYIVKINVNSSGLVESATASRNFFTKNFNNQHLIKKIMLGVCQTGDPIPPLLDKISNISIQGSALRFEIATIILHHRYSQCKGNVALHLWMIDPISDKVVRYYCSRTCCDKKIAGFLG